jgi:hypothetical protein
LVSSASGLGGGGGGGAALVVGRLGSLSQKASWARSSAVLFPNSFGPGLAAAKASALAIVPSAQAAALESADDPDDDSEDDGQVTESCGGW